MSEKIEILVLLARDQDETICTTAFNTLLAWDARELVQVISNPATPIGILEFVANHATIGRKELVDALLSNAALPNDLRELVKQTPVAVEEVATPPPPPAVPEPGAGETHKRETLLQRIGRMTAAEKIKTALTGNQEERLLLIRDSNKVVSRAVLQSPKLTDQEIENVASMKSVTEEVLRLVATSRKFMKSYNVVRALINNPRLPIDLGLHMLNRLNERDLKGLMLNKNIAEVVRSMALKSVKAKEEASKPKVPGKKH